MKKIALGFMFATAFSATANAATEKEVAKIVKQYSETVACQILEVADEPKQYKTLLVQEGFNIEGEKDRNGIGALFLTYWAGDVGCAGGNGTVTPNFTIVEQRGFQSANPVVTLDYKFPELEMAYFTDFQVKGGIVTIKGLSYGEKDRQHNPTKKVTYRLKFGEGGFIKF